MIVYFAFFNLNNVQASTLDTFFLCTPNEAHGKPINGVTWSAEMKQGRLMWNAPFMPPNAPYLFLEEIIIYQITQ